MRARSTETGSVQPKRSRLKRIALWSAAVGLGVPVSLVVIATAGVLVFANIPYGQRVIEQQAHSLTGGMIGIEGLDGAFPYALNVRRLTLNDRLGTWLEVDNLRLRWSPLALLSKTVRASALEADRLYVPRLLVTDPSPVTPAPASSTPSGLHLAVQLARLHIGRIDIGSALAGVAASFSVDGRLALADLAPILDGLQLDRLPVADLALDLHRLDRPADLTLRLATPRHQASLHLLFHDGANGLVSQFTKLSQLDPMAVALDLRGPVRQNAMSLSVKAGAIAADASGTLDLLHHQGNLSLHAETPAMTLDPGIAWSRFSLGASLQGDLLAPSGQGALDLDNLAAGGAGVTRLSVRFAGTEGQGARADHIRVHLRADGVRAPGLPAALLAQAPVEADLTAEPNAPELPVTIALSHTLFRLDGHAALKPKVTGVADLVLPDLEPLAAIGHVALQGHSVTHAAFSYDPEGQSRLDLTDALGVTGGMKQAVALVGDNARLALSLSATTPRPEAGKPETGQTVTIEKLDFDGTSVGIRDHGHIVLGQPVSLVNDLSLTLPDLKRVAPQLQGGVGLDAHIEGPLQDLAARLLLSGRIGAHAVPAGPLKLDASVTHLPAAPEGTIHADGQLDGKKLALDVGFARHADGAMDVLLDALDWASLSGKGHLTLPAGASVPLGTLAVSVHNLGDFSALAGQSLAGRIGLDIRTSDPDASHPPVVTLAVKGAIQTPQARVGGLDLSGTIANPVNEPDFNLGLGLTGLAVQGMSGQAKLGARGPLRALALTASTTLQNVLGAPASLDTAMLLDLPEKTVRIDRLAVLAKGEALHLNTVSTVRFGEVLGIDRLALSVAPQGVSPATLDLAGTIKPHLALRLRLDHVTPALAKPFAPTFDATGLFSAQADLTGDLAHPGGNASLALHDFRMRSGPGESLPPLSMQSTIVLSGESARIDARADAGTKIALRANGTVPTGGNGAIDIRTKGGIDLSVANAVIGAQGMALSGRTDFDLGISGAMTAPRANGRVDIRGVNFTHYGQGVRLTDIGGSILAANDSFQFQNIVAHAGKGQFAINGSVAALRPGMPLDLHITASKAQPITSDLLTAVIDMDLHAHGQMTSRLDVDGAIRLPSVIVNIPNSMPASVPQLDVIRPGQKKAVQASSLVIGLAVDVISPGEFFVRGHGLDAEMSGKLHVGGLSTAPDISGGFDLRRGFFNLAGVNLNFTKGRVAFDGSGVNHKLDPSLDFRADRNVQGTLASLVVGGYASEPKIDFTSVPSLPRDQVLSMLLFGSSTASLSTTQLAELATAVAQLTGASSFDPLGKMRGLLGLDRLAVGGGSGVNNGGASVEAGKYVMKGVYVGAKQATSGSGTQAQVQVDLTRRLKLNTTVGTGGQVTGFTTPENDPGSSIGLSYGLDY